MGLVVPGLLMLLCLVWAGYGWYKWKAAPKSVSLSWLYQWMARHPQKIWLGYGFRWRARHSRRLYGHHQRGRARPLLQLGYGWHLKHAVGAEAGNNLIMGAPGSGKSVMLRLLAIQAMKRNEAVLILDPKGGSGLLNPLRQAAQALQRPWYQLLPEQPLQSDGINPLAHGLDAGELASRIARLLPRDESDNVFGQFAWMTLSRLITALQWLELPVTLHSIHQAFLDRGNHLESLLVGAGIEFNHPVLSGVRAVSEHDPVHFQKMSMALQPVLQSLASGQLGELLAPPSETNVAGDGGACWSGRPLRFISLSQLVEQGGVLYVGLQSLSNPQLARMLGGILLSDMAALAGQRYGQNRAKGVVQLFVDEAAEVANPALLQLMNKGRECGWVVTLATQTMADLEAAQGDRVGARMLLGNVANVFAFRLLDRDGRQWLMERLGSCWLKSETRSSGSQWARMKMGIKAGRSDSLSWRYEELPMIPESALASQPNYNYLGLLGGQKLVAGQVPLLKP